MFASSGCGGCHTLAAANATGTVGPNLDQLKPDYRAVTAQVTNGGAAMPSFKSSLSTQQIADVVRLRRHLDRRHGSVELPAAFPAHVAAFAFDLDRTLIAEDGVLRPRTREALARTRATGAHVVVVTGRMFRAVRPYLEQAQLDDLVVCYQGAVVADPATGEFLLHVPIPLGEAREAMDAVLEAGFHLKCYVDDELYVAEVTPEARRYADFQHLEIHAVGDLRPWLERRAADDVGRGLRPRVGGFAADACSQSPTKLVAVGDPAALDELEAELKPRFAGRLFISKSLPYFLEFAHPDVSKGSGLEFVAERLGFRPRGDGRVRRRRERPRTARLGRFRRRRRERASRRARARRLVVPAVRGGRRRCPARELPRLRRVIDPAPPAPTPDEFRADSRARAPPRRSTRARRRRALARARAAGRRAARAARSSRASRPRSSSRSCAASRRSCGRPRRELAAAEAARDEAARAGAESARRLGSRRLRPTRTPRRSAASASRRRRRAEGAHRDRPLRHGARGAALRLPVRLPHRRHGARRDGALPLRARHAPRTHGHTPMLPPVLVREEAMYGTGFFPTERSNIYALEADELYLTGTSEVALAGLHMGEILEELPLRYTAFSTNFRREAGAAGKDTRGMFRVHQFNKVELFVYCEPVSIGRGARAAARDRGGDPPGARAAVPRRQRRRRRPRRAGGEEVRHRGLVPVPAALPRDDFRRRTRPTSRLAAWGFATARGSDLEPVHTLNGTATTDRGLLAILENFSGDVPDVLREYGAPERVTP